MLASQDWADTGYDGGGTDGVKLEQMVHVTHDGVQPLSTYDLALH